jgi:hypothetical protein
MKIDFDHFRGAEIATGNMTQAKREAAALSTLIKHVEDTERMLYGLATADFDGDWCITRFNCQYRATKYDEDGTTLKESRYYQDPLSAFLALEEKK